MVVLVPALLLAVAGAVRSNAQAFDPLQYVDPLIGTGSDGHSFAGASLPYGFAKAVADTDSGNNQGGFVSDEANVNVTGFSGMHDSGTGGDASLGNFPIFPYAFCPNNDVNRCAFPKNARKIGYIADSLASRPGFFGLTLNSGVRAEMTVSNHTSLYRFSFPPNATAKAPDSTASPLILLDLTDLSNSRMDNASVTVDPKTGRMVGQGKFRPSFAGGQYELFFCVDFAGAEIAESGIFADSRASAAVQSFKISRGINGYPLPGGGWVRFRQPQSDTIFVRSATSFISEKQACAHAEREIPEFEFDETAAAATAVWREKLSVIEVSPNRLLDQTLLKNFYSGFYRTMLNPQDYTGENPFWKSSEPYFDSFYCLWDSFRSQIPFLVVVDPIETARMIRGLIDIYVHDGWLPDCRMSLSRGYTQGGSNADIVLADAYVKGLREGIDWSKGYEAVVKDAEVEPFDWCCRGRGGLDSWREVGYIPVSDFDYKGFGTMTRSISRTLEYSYNDYVISLMAEGLSKIGEAEKYQDRSNNWANLFKNDVQSTIEGTNMTFTGFLQPRHRNRTWGIQNPLKCSGRDNFVPQSVCSLQNNAVETYESSIWEYSFFVPHDQASLINLFGSPKAYVDRLEYLHNQNITGIGNEPSFLTVFQYHYAGRPALSARRSHYYIPDFFKPTRGGLPGNDDSGAMGSFICFSMMGLFPNPGQNIYLITPPFFESVAIRSPLTGRTARVVVANFDPTYRAIYIQSATLNGVPYTRNWIDHSFFLEGKTLEITVGVNESAWGTRVQDLPFSLGTYKGFSGERLVRDQGAGARRLAPGLELGREGSVGAVGFE